MLLHLLGPKNTANENRPEKCIIYTIYIQHTLYIQYITVVRVIRKCTLNTYTRIRLNQNVY